MNAVAGQVNFFDPAVIADPFGYYQEALAHGPVQSSRARRADRA